MKAGGLLLPMQQRKKKRNTVNSRSLSSHAFCLDFYFIIASCLETFSLNYIKYIFYSVFSLFMCVKLLIHIYSVSSQKDFQECMLGIYPFVSDGMKI